MRDLEYEYAVYDSPETPGVGRWVRRLVGPWELDPNDTREASTIETLPVRYGD